MDVICMLLGCDAQAHQRLLVSPGRSYNDGRLHTRYEQQLRRPLPCDPGQALSVRWQVQRHLQASQMCQLGMLLPRVPTTASTGLWQKMLKAALAESCRSLCLV